MYKGSSFFHRLKGALCCGIGRSRFLWAGLCLAFVLLGSASGGYAAAAPAAVEFPREQVVLVTKKGARHPVTVELATTPEQRATGLMFRTELASGAGMLFDFGQEMTVRMWMKNTFIPLDMLFFNAKGELIFIAANAQPHDLTPLGPDQPVAMVLELPAGQGARWGITVGDRVQRSKAP